MITTHIRIVSELQVNSSVTSYRKNFKSPCLKLFQDNDLIWKSTVTANDRIKRHISEKPQFEPQASLSNPTTAQTHQIRIISAKWSNDEISDEILVSSSQINNVPQIHSSYQRTIHRRHGEHAIRHLHHNRHTTERKKREQHKAKKIINLVKPQEVFQCPTKDPAKQHITIVRVDEICDGVPTCPNSEDENPTGYTRTDGVYEQGIKRSYNQKTNRTLKRLKLTKPQQYKVQISTANESQ
uniref:Uncharacterized protein n=1 Tax=Syphacia muris TaxID=451379 RepID=A0A158R3U2_9BILA